MLNDKNTSISCAYTSCVNILVLALTTHSHNQIYYFNHDKTQLYHDKPSQQTLCSLGSSHTTRPDAGLSCHHSRTGPISISQSFMVASDPISHSNSHFNNYISKFYFQKGQSNPLTIKIFHKILLTAGIHYSCQKSLFMVDRPKYYF